MSDTPETDNECENNGIGLPLPQVRADFARTLERQRDEARARISDLEFALNSEKPWHQKAQELLDGGRWAGHSYLEGCVTELEEAQAEAQRLRETILRILPGMKAQKPPALGAWNWPYAVKEFEEALEGPTVTTNHTSPTIEQAKIDMQASYDHMMSSKTSRRIITAHGKEWWVHVPGDPMPCSRTLKVCVLTSLEGPTDPSRADHLGWHVRDEDEGYFWGKIIAWRPADAPDKLPREGGEGCPAHSPQP